MIIFVLPEFLWGGLITTFINLGFVPLLNSEAFFTNFPIMGHLNFFLEIIGVFGLLFINSKHNYKNNIFKYLLAGILLIILVAQLYIIYMYYTFSPSFP